MGEESKTYLLLADNGSGTEVLLKTFENVGLGEAQEEAEELISNWEDELSEWEDDNDDEGYEDEDEEEDNEDEEEKFSPFRSLILPGLHEGDNIILRRKDGGLSLMYVDGWEQAPETAQGETK